MKPKYSLWVLFLGLFVSCTANQQQVMQKVFDKTPAILSSIAKIYGGPYAGLVQSFYEIATILGDGDKASFAQTAQPPYPVPQQPDPRYSGSPQGAYGTSPYPIAQPPDPGYAGPPQGVYDASPSSGPPQPQQLEVEMDVVKEVVEQGIHTARSVRDGDVLTSKDNYKIIFRSHTECFIYIVQLDATGKMDPLFPSSFTRAKNPVRPGTTYYIPPGKKWFYLDENVGVETIYFIASRTPRKDLESLFSQLSEQNKQLVKRAPDSITDTVVIMRGVGGVRQGQNVQVTFQDGSKGDIAPPALSSIRADFVTTRWFNHR